MLKVYYLITFLINYLVPHVLKFRLLKKKEDPDRYKEKLGKYIKNTPGEYIWSVSYTHLTLPTKRIV